MANRKDNIKRLISEMDSKSDFVQEVADYYNKSYIYVLQNWFQSRWNIPEECLDNIIQMAQNWLFNQTNRKRQILTETGFKA